MESAFTTATIWLALAVLSTILASHLIGMFRKEKNEKWYYTLLMSTGLTFGTISALYGYSHGIVSREQYSLLVTAVIASAVIPTMIANFAFMPKHLLSKADAGEKAPQAVYTPVCRDNNGTSGLDEE